MAFLIKRNRSPYFWIRYRKSSGKGSESTRLRWDDPAQARQARDLVRQANEDEKFTRSEKQMFVQWVPKLLRERYGANALNYKAYNNRWRALEPYLTSRKVLYAKDLTAEIAWEYIFWRTGNKKREGGVRQACRNSALEELKLLKMLMKHAVAIGYASRNPLDSLRFKWDAQKEKPEITDEDLPKILDALEKAPEWMRIQFLISFHTGCRLHETRVPLACVDLAKRRIHFPDAKMNRPFTAPLPPQLVALFTELKADKRRKFAFTPDCNLHTMSVRWCHFFKELGMPYSFHSCRISFITRCIRAGVPENITMKLVNHGSVSISRHYQRLSVEDVERMADAIYRHAPETRGTLGVRPATARRRKP
jgi:integrase